ncbi:hypothetical protein [Zooshikella sp. RANM57]|uniref:hypothetical protein n=1 Tax=Zooshikella sp. RANM57 TaxID=3425863 RepID=UPI003D6F4697
MAQHKITKLYITTITSTVQDAQSGARPNVYIQYANQPGVDQTPATHTFTNAIGPFTNGGIQSVALDLTSLKDDVYTIQEVVFTTDSNDWWLEKSVFIHALYDNGYVATITDITNWPGLGLSNQNSDGGVYSQPVFPYAAGEVPQN